MQKEPLHPLHPPHPKSVQSPANSFPIFSPPVSPCPPHLKNGVTFTALAEKCCQRLSQSAEKFQRVSRGNPTLVNSECYISDIAALGESKNYLLMGFQWQPARPVCQNSPKVSNETWCNVQISLILLLLFCCDSLRILLLLLKKATLSSLFKCCDSNTNT